MRPAFYLAQKMGARLGGCKILFRALPSRAGPDCVQTAAGFMSVRSILGDERSRDIRAALARTSGSSQWILPSNQHRDISRAVRFFNVFDPNASEGRHQSLFRRLVAHSIARKNRYRAYETRVKIAAASRYRRFEKPFGY
jgi:hypothetical protein